MTTINTYGDLYKKCYELIHQIKIHAPSNILLNNIKISPEEYNSRFIEIFGGLQRVEDLFILNTTCAIVYEETSPKARKVHFELDPEHEVFVSNIDQIIYKYKTFLLLWYKCGKVVKVETSYILNVNEIDEINIRYFKYNWSIPKNLTQTIVATSLMAIKEIQDHYYRCGSNRCKSSLRLKKYSEPIHFANFEQFEKYYENNNIIAHTIKNFDIIFNYIVHNINNAACSEQHNEKYSEEIFIDLDSLLIMNNNEFSFDSIINIEELNKIIQQE